MTWDYEKLDEAGKIKTIGDYSIDSDASITGKHIINVKAYFDENPDEARRLGWTKHIHWTAEEIDERWPHTQSQYLVKSARQVDEWTVEDMYHVMDKSEEQMLLEELLESAGWGNVITFG